MSGKSALMPWLTNWQTSTSGLILYSSVCEKCDTMIRALIFSGDFLSTNAKLSNQARKVFWTTNLGETRFRKSVTVNTSCTSCLIGPIKIAIQYSNLSVLCWIPLEKEDCLFEVLLDGIKSVVLREKSSETDNWQVLKAVHGIFGLSGFQCKEQYPCFRCWKRF